MRIDKVNQGPVKPVSPTKPADKVNQQEEKVKPQKDEYIPAPRQEEPATYSKPDTQAIARLKAESEKAYGNLRQLVEQLLARQGMTFQGLKLGDGEVVEVDDTARAEAAALIAEGGELSAEKVSDRILEFAKAVSGGDKSKLGMLRGAIEEGFKAAKSMLGGQLPEISQRTYDMTMQKLDEWMRE